MPKIDHNPLHLSASCQGLVRHIGDAALILRAGHIVLANEAFSQITGLEPAQTHGRPFAEFAAAKDQDRVRHFCARALSTTEAPWQIEFSMAHPGQDISVRMAVTPLGLDAAATLLAVLITDPLPKNTASLVREVRTGVGEMFHTLNTQLMHIVNAKDGIVEDLDTLQALVREMEISQSAAWIDAQSSLDTYCNGLHQACRKIMDATRAFNSLFSAVIKKHTDD